jgi:hypothetical protein
MATACTCKGKWRWDRAGGNVVKHKNVAEGTPPWRVKNLRPLRLNGRWLAVTMTPPSYMCPVATQEKNMAGVVARPQLPMLPPLDATPDSKLDLQMHTAPSRLARNARAPNNMGNC